MLEKIGFGRKAPEPIIGRADDGIEKIAEEKKPPELLVSDYLASLNRKERRVFARRNGIFVHGSRKPVINSSETK